MKISIITDVEGTSGSVWSGYGLPDAGEYSWYQEVMTAEINTVVRTLQAEGVNDIFVYEAHPFREGVLPQTVRRGRGFERLAGSAALFFVGQHGPAGVWEAVIAHTMNSQLIYAARLNGRVCGELTMAAALAGAQGIPTVFVAGERQTGREAARNLPGPLEFVCDEVGLANHAAICRPYRSLEKELAEKTRRALQHIGRTKPYDLGSVTFELKMRYQGISEKLLRLPFARRRGDWVVIEAPDMMTLYRYYYVVIAARDFWHFKTGAPTALPARRGSPSRRA